MNNERSALVHRCGEGHVAVPLLPLWLSSLLLVCVSKLYDSVVVACDFEGVIVPLKRGRVAFIFTPLFH